MKEEDTGELLKKTMIKEGKYELITPKKVKKEKRKGLA